MKRAGIACGAAALAFFTAFPFAWMVLTAFKRPYEIFTTPPTFLPASYTLENVTQLFEQTRFGTYLANSVLVASATVDGNIKAPKIIVAEGARFRGAVDMGSARPKETVKSS